MKKNPVNNEFLFYAETISEGSIQISRDEFVHIARVLRLNTGSRISLTDGKGNLAYATIDKISKHEIYFTEIELQNTISIPYRLHIAIAPTKNMSRFEWFVEKAVELGITEITPVLTEHSERKHLRTDRLDKIAITAMKQTRSCWKPCINPLTDYAKLVPSVETRQGYIAHLTENAVHFGKKINFAGKTICVLIGPEGGFTESEVQLAVHHGFEPVLLAGNRLRTETAGITACCAVKLMYETSTGNLNLTF